MELQVHASQEVVAVEEVIPSLHPQDREDLEAEVMDKAQVVELDNLELLIPVAAEEMADQL